MAAVTGGLPAEVSSFVGRRRELAEVRRLVAGHRVVTLAGMGGVGKTRLAVQAARRVGRSFGDGVAFVELAGVEEEALLVPAVGQAVGWVDPQEGLSAVALGAYLANREMLLVLDNCEHLLDACARLCGVVLGAAPGVRVLATSRRRLGVGGERVLPVPALGVPKGVVSAGEAATGWDGVALFAERARSQVPSFVVGEENVGEVVELCRRLEGLPLALELAASRLRTEPVGRILRELERPGVFLGGPVNRRPAGRQRSLEDLIAWSYRLLSGREQTALARLCVFPAGMDLDAAEWVCAGEGVQAGDVWEVLARLVDHSLVVHDGNGRYRILEMIQRFGLRELAQAGEEDRVRRRHRDYYEQLAAKAAGDWFGPREGEGAAWLQRERPNLHAALDYSLGAPGEEEHALRLAVDLWPWWTTRTEYSEALYWTERALALSPVPTALRSQALAGGAVAASIQGRFAFAEAQAGEAQEIAERLKDPAALGFAVFAAAAAAFYQGRLEISAGLFREVEDNPDAPLHCVAGSLVTRSVLLDLAGHTGQAVAAAERGLALCEERGDQRIRGLALVWLGVLAWRAGEQQRAVELCRESLRSQRELGVPNTVSARALQTLGWITAETNPTEAARLLGTANAAWRRAATDVGRPFAEDDEQALRTLRRTLTQQQLNDALDQGGALRQEEAIASVLDGLALPPSRGRRPADRGDGLTAREGEVAHLVAEGLTSKQIAARLVISPRTAEGHIQRIMTKLGFTSRTQITAWASLDPADGSRERRRDPPSA